MRVRLTVIAVTLPRRPAPAPRSRGDGDGAEKPPRARPPRWRSSSMAGRSMLRPPRSFLAGASVLVALVLAGCGMQAEGGKSTDARIIATRAFGRSVMGATILQGVPDDETVLGLTRRSFRDVRTGADGDSDVASIDGVPAGPDGAWDFWVNGIGYDDPAAEVELHGG